MHVSLPAVYTRAHRPITLKHQRRNGAGVYYARLERGDICVRSSAPSSTGSRQRQAASLAARSPAVVFCSSTGTTH